MRYTYAYKSSDGLRHEAVMEAASREAVFIALRRQGIKAIKVVAADGSKANGAMRGVRKRIVVAVVAGVAVVVGGAAFWLGLNREKGVLSSVGFSVGPTRVAQPLPRQMIPGDRLRLAAARESLTNVAERTLAAFAEPGRPLPMDFSIGADGSGPTDADYRQILLQPLRISDSELTESVDLKRIVTSLKREMQEYLDGGGAVGDYLAACVKRQKQEIDFRSRAEGRLSDLIVRAAPIRADSAVSDPEARRRALDVAYDYWLKANAQMQSMGIYPLPLPDALREYQHSLKLEN